MTGTFFIRTRNVAYTLPVARMQRSGIREMLQKKLPDSASLHPGYMPIL